MNTQAITAEIAKLEREKAQLEVRAEQLKKERDGIEEALKSKGLTVSGLDTRIAELTEQVNAELAKIGLAHLADTKPLERVGATAEIDEFESI